MRIDTMTAAQAARMPEWTKKWLEIGLSTEPADFDAATEAALKAYKLCNLNPPMVILRMGSPYAATFGGIIAWAYLREFAKHAPIKVESQVESQVWSQVESQVRLHVESQVESQVRLHVESQVESQVLSQVESPVWSQVRAQVWSQVESQVRLHVESQVESQVLSQVESPVWSVIGNDRGGAFWASWCGYVTFMRDVLGWQDPALERFEIDEALTKSCGWVWWHENVLAISDRPESLHRDDQGRLHNTSGPSIRYRDGWSLWHHRGVLVPQRVIEQPETLTVPQIESEQNTEVRRVMIERYGQARFLRDSGAEVVNRDESGILYRKQRNCKRNGGIHMIDYAGPERAEFLKRRSAMGLALLFAADGLAWFALGLLVGWWIWR
ncbi:DUF6745 domain-containing protein [Sphingomonas sp.]|uniref:DUF6745 domain-containing protein n=1 Tax=Sphingomonas sp. TaxID=28214 RepID=UPI0025CEB432|nr:hypothetical protein [Sphingomonas sp.]